jgi:hypothetical protein
MDKLRALSLRLGSIRSNSHAGNIIYALRLLTDEEMGLITAKRVNLIKLWSQYTRTSIPPSVCNADGEPLSPEASIQAKVDWLFSIQSQLAFVLVAE